MITWSKMFELKMGTSFSCRQQLVACADCEGSDQHLKQHELVEIELL
jgi:hypothetical protein